MREFLNGALSFILYIIPAAIIALFSRKLIKIPDELFRKILHFILLGAYIPLIFAFEKWWMASGFAVILIIILYPFLSLVEKIPAFSEFLNQRREGEIKNSMVLAVSMMALSTSVCWGIFGDRFFVLACVYAWGVGDAFAALFGKRFGKHKIKLPLADKNKSVEGTAAMFTTSAVSVFTVLMIRGGMGIFECAVTAILAAAASAYVELCTKNGYDTFTCPAAAMAIILPMIKILGG